MSKTNIEKAIEKQIKANKDAARIEQRRQEASEIVNSQPTLSGMRIIDEDSEKVLEAILEQYDGNEDNYIDFKEETLSRPLAESIALQYTKLKMYGLISSIQAYWGGAMITLSNTALTYKERKKTAIQKDDEEKNAHKKLETDFLKIQNLSVEQLREIYLQSILINNTLESSIELQKKQLNVLESIFVSSEDGVEVQKELLKP